MNLHRGSRFANPFVTLLAIAVIFILMAFTIQILSAAFHFVGSLAGSSSGQAAQLVTVISTNR
jgi:hypothetical protein